MRFAALLAAMLALAACQWDPPHQGARDASVPPLDVAGYGDMRIGMTLAEARTASGQPLNAEALEPDIPGACSEQEYRAADGDTLYLMFEGDKLTSITASEHGAHTRTAQNVGVGSSDEEVRAAYQNLVQEPSHYGGPPAHNLIAWTVPDQSGLLFEVNEGGIVTAVHAGGPSILYMEGCA